MGIEASRADGSDTRERADGRDLALLDRLARLHTAAVSDCLDRAGHRNNVMDPRIRPLDEGSTLVGYAATVEAQLVNRPPMNPDDNYKGELGAVDALQPGDVMVVSTCRGAYWGELLATASRARGANGIVADAYTRDGVRLIEMGFPTFVAGINAQDSLGRVDVVSSGERVSCGGVKVHTGDLVIANFDGVAIIPAAQGPEIIEAAEAKVAREDEMRSALRGGMPVRRAFATYEVL